MGTQQSRSGHGRQGSHQQSQQNDRRPQQDRDLQRVKQGDRGQQRQGGDTNRQQGEQPEVQQSQLGGGRDFEHNLENERREQNRMQQAERRQLDQQTSRTEPSRGSGDMDALRGGGDRGEGSYAGTRQYDKAVKDFAESGRVEEAARAASPKTPAEAREMEAAEAEGKRHAKGEDPALTRRTSSPSGAPRPGHEEQ